MEQMDLQQFTNYAFSHIGKVEVLEHQPLYDTLEISNKLGRARFFEMPMGTGKKTHQDTNLYLPGTLPAPQCFFVKGISLCIVDGIGPMEFYKSVVTFLIGSKVYLTYSPLSPFLVNPMELRIIQGFSVSLGIMISQYFSLEVDVSNLPYKMKPFSLRCQLSGYFYRAVQ